MSLAIGEDHLALLDAARRFTAARCDQKVVREAVDAETEALPPFWDELVGLGWLDLGAEGYGLAEVAVVLEELGRVMAPGPMLPTVWAAACMAAPCDGPASVCLDGFALGGAVAETMVVPDGDGWGIVRREGFTATAVESLDPTRRVATVEVTGDVEPLPGLTTERVRSLAAVLFAAECAGGAAWCVETASSYAKVREQFGRPIGKFQAVKHKCADMLVAVEQTRAVAWDAARDGDDLAAAAAGAVAPDAFARVAKDCIQVLGGIGFTWEHDAHLYLRRAMTVRQLLGGTAPWRRSVATAALAGARRQLTVDLPAEAEAVRTEVRAFAESIAELPREERRRRLVESGYAVPHWPEPWGRGAEAVEQLVIEEELRRARIRFPNLAVGAWAAPTIAAHGTPEQQERWVGPTLLGEIAWCQLFSEPGAGSDLAALRTTATRTDGGWLLNGQKVWTSMAKDADWGICLVRTNPDAPKHLGITYVIVDMKADGIDIRPLRELTGMEMFNEVFLDDVFVPDDCVIGEVDGGWPLARTTLGNERVAMGSGSSFGGGIESLLTLVGELPELDPISIDHVGELVAEAHSVAVLGLRSTSRSLAGGGPGPEASVRKLLGVEHDQRTQELGLALLGAHGATTIGPAAQWTFGFLANRCLTIAGGTSEIQRNVIGERLLGLPRDDRLAMTELLTDQLRIMADAFPDEVGYVDVSSGEELTFLDWERRSNSLARWLIGNGVEKGDRVAIHLPPARALDWLVAYYATHKAGAVAVPTSTRLVERELGFVLDHAGAAVAFTADPAPLPDLRAVLVAGTDGWTAALGADSGEVQVPLDGGDIADIMYTSGTTGRPKGVVVRHRNVAMVPNGKPRWSGKGWLHASPFFTFAGIACASNPMKLGLKGMYMPRFDAGQWLEVVERERPLATFLVPAFAELLIAHPRFDEADLSSVAICPLGSAPIAPATLTRLQERFVSATVQNSWGMTEAGPAFCSMPPEEAARRIGSVGKPMPPTEFLIVGDDGTALPAGEIGELLVRNPGREREYFNDPEATASTWRDGWLHSGDLAYLDADGFLYIVGRQKDVIIRGGNNVHAGDVESVLYEHPAVQEAAVASVPHTVLGEDIGAWVVVKGGIDVDEEELPAFCAERLSDYKVPRRFTFLDELPRNATGKVIKKDLPR